MVYPVVIIYFKRLKRPVKSTTPINLTFIQNILMMMVIPFFQLEMIALKCSPSIENFYSAEKDDGTCNSKTKLVYGKEEVQNLTLKNY